MCPRYPYIRVYRLYVSGILPCYCYYCYSSLVNMLKLCSFHNWENTSNLKRDKHPTGVRLSPLFILAAVTIDQNVTVVMLVRFDSLLWAWSTKFIYCHMMICACTLLLFRHNAQILLACNYSHIMLSVINTSLDTCTMQRMWMSEWTGSQHTRYYHLCWQWYGTAAHTVL